MRFLVFVSLLAFLSCKQNTAKEKEPSLQVDSSKTNPDSANSGVGQTGPGNADQKVTPLETALNKQLKIKFGSQWHVVNDSEAKWPKDEYDYFIAPKRKTDPDYPYIAKGDFNIDGKPDYAALITNDTKNIYQIAILLGNDNIVFWKEDIDLTAISTFPKTNLESIDGKKARMKGDGINVEYYEKSSFVIYWNGVAFKRVWTGD